MERAYREARPGCSHGLGPVTAYYSELRSGAFGCSLTLRDACGSPGDVKAQNQAPDPFFGNLLPVARGAASQTGSCFKSGEPNLRLIRIGVKTSAVALLCKKPKPRSLEVDSRHRSRSLFGGTRPRDGRRLRGPCETMRLLTLATKKSPSATKPSRT